MPFAASMWTTHPHRQYLALDRCATPASAGRTKLVFPLSTLHRYSVVLRYSLLSPSTPFTVTPDLFAEALALLASVLPSLRHLHIDQSLYKHPPSAGHLGQKYCFSISSNRGRHSSLFLLSSRSFTISTSYSNIIIQLLGLLPGTS